MAELNILHLSDLHFGTITKAGADPRPAHFFVRQSGGGSECDPEQLADILISDCDARPPDLVVASGDIGWSCSERDYELSHEFFSKLRDAWKDAQFVLAPGNHDVDRKAADDSARQAAFVAFLKRFHGDEFETLHPLFEDDRDDLVSVHTVSIEGVPQALVVSMNSAGGLQADSTPVRVHPATLRKLDRFLRSGDYPENLLRIFVIHHHVFPFAQPARTPSDDTRTAWEKKADPALLANSAKIQSWLAQRRFHVVLHGHKHVSHGREDLLWRKNDLEERRLLVVGAGSAGVEDGHRSHDEPLSFNRVTAVRFSDRRWRVRVQVQKICTDLAMPEARPYYDYSALAGVQRATDLSPPCYQAERMDDCHRAIAAETSGSGQLHGFVSVVEDAEYAHPSTARFRGGRATQERVEDCFLSLHPEYEPTKGWTDLAAVDRHSDGAHSFQFEHGSRWFRSPDGRTRRTAEEVWKTSPLLRCIHRLERNPGSNRAYVSLFQPVVDVLAEGTQPLPGLMGIQFVQRDGFLHAVATFRKIELSFWWCVNMLEISRLLTWAAGHLNMKRGSITFFAGLAEWKEEPEAPVRAKLDTATMESLLKLTFDGDWAQLTELLKEKAALMNENNLVAKGLCELGQYLSVHLADAPGEEKNELHRSVCEACKAIQNATQSDSLTQERHRQEASAALARAVELCEALVAHTGS